MSKTIYFLFTAPILEHLGSVSRKNSIKTTFQKFTSIYYMRTEITPRVRVYHRKPLKPAGVRQRCRR